MPLSYCVFQIAQAQEGQKILAPGNFDFYLTINPIYTYEVQVRPNKP